MAYHYDFVGSEGGVDLVCDSCGNYLGWVKQLEETNKGFLLCPECTAKGVKEVVSIEERIKDAVILDRGTKWWSRNELENFIIKEAEELGEEQPKNMAARLVETLYY